MAHSGLIVAHSVFIVSLSGFIVAHSGLIGSLTETHRLAHSGS